MSALTATIAAPTDAAFLDAIRAAGQIAAEQAGDVDRNARFPKEGIAALREAQALSAYVPERLGGLGVSFDALGEACFELGRCCANTAMVFAMHQIQVHSLVGHTEGSDWYERYLESLVAEQRLISSATSEVGTGGDLGASVAALTTEADGRVSFTKQAPTISYGVESDDLLTTLRRTPDAEPGDQILILTSIAETTMETMGGWDPMGMRGTCSPGAVLSATASAEQVVPTSFAEVSAQSMVPSTHILWAWVWLGIATDAFDRARAFVRAAAAKDATAATTSGVKLSHLLAELTLMRAEVRQAHDQYVEAAENYPESLSTVATALRINMVKITAADAVARICQGALGVCGIMGYKNDTPFSVGRHIRDSLSASLMVTNDRIHRTNAQLLLVAKDV
ncbi:MAG: acyl-CoA dehydrogenase family protein [Baekduia sp.]